MEETSTTFQLLLALRESILNSLDHSWARSTTRPEPTHEDFFFVQKVSLFFPGLAIFIPFTHHLRMCLLSPYQVTKQMSLCVGNTLAQIRAPSLVLLANPPKMDIIRTLLHHRIRSLVRALQTKKTSSDVTKDHRSTQIRTCFLDLCRSKSSSGGIRTSARIMLQE